MTSERNAIIIKVGNDDIDISALRPLTLGDKKKLKSLGVDFSKFVRNRHSQEAVTEPEDEIIIVLFVLQKFRPQTTAAEVEELPIMTCGRIMEFMVRRATEVDDPFSTRSTSSPASTAGASAN